MKRHNLEQQTEEWHHIRKGKITGTTLKSIMGTPKARQDAIYEIIAERLTEGVDMDHENPMDRGNRLEPDAIASFELETGKSVERIGFCEDDTNPMIANSPDGLIGENEAVEVKCMGGKNHVKMWLTNETPDEYDWQIIQYFIVNEKLEKLYFVGYNPDITVHPMHIIEVTREEVTEKIEKGKKAQETFLEEVESILKTIIKL
jgi:putative phage-type endonuclease